VSGRARRILADNGAASEPSVARRHGQGAGGVVHPAGAGRALRRRSGLCNRYVRFVLERDRRRQFRFASLQGAFGARALARHGMHLEGTHLDRIARIAGLSARTRVRSLGRGAEHHDRIGRSVAAGGRAARDSPLLARRRLRSRGACTIPDLRPARQLPASSADGRGPVPRLMDDPAARPVRDDIARRHLQREIRWPGVSRALPAARRDLGGAAAPSRHQAGHGAPLPGGSGAGHGADARAEVRPTRR
jgi:hypothetical protein